MKTIGIRALRTQLSECVRLAAAGIEEFNIACHGKIIARLSGSTESGSLTTTSSSVVESGSRYFVVDKSLTRELKEIAQERLLQIQTMSFEELRMAFREEIGYVPPSSMSQYELQLACGRAFQYKLWIDRVGAVPGDIGLRDLEFWYRLLLPQKS